MNPTPAHGADISARRANGKAWLASYAGVSAKANEYSGNLTCALIPIRLFDPFVLPDYKEGNYRV